MPTTPNLDADVVAAIREAAREQRRSLSRVANELIRAGVRCEQGAFAHEPYEPPVFDTGVPLVDVTNVAAALEFLDGAR